MSVSEGDELTICTWKGRHSDSAKSMSLWSNSKVSRSPAGALKMPSSPHSCRFSIKRDIMVVDMLVSVKVSQGRKEQERRALNRPARER